MAHHPYPNRDRSLRHLRRNQVRPAPKRQSAFRDLIVYSEQHAEVMRRALPTAAQFISRFRAATGAIPT